LDEQEVTELTEKENRKWAKKRADFPQMKRMGRCEKGRAASVPTARNWDEQEVTEVTEREGGGTPGPAMNRSEPRFFLRFLCCSC